MSYILTAKIIIYIFACKMLDGGRIPRDYYKNWSKSSIEERTNNGLGEIIINRVGWRHISRKQRGYDKIFQSWQLLSVAKQIIRKVEKAYQISKIETSNNQDYNYQLRDIISLRAKVIFPNRQQSIVQVVLKRKRTFDKVKNKYVQKVWLYSVYEPRKGVKIE